MSLNFGERGILDSVEKLARDLLDLEGRVSGMSGPRLRPTRPQAASEPSCGGFPGPRPSLAPPPSTGPDSRARLSRIPRVYKFGDRNRVAQAIVSAGTGPRLGGAARLGDR
jgi:hypothetical protein